MKRTKRWTHLWFRLSVKLPVAALVILGLTVTILVALAMQFHTTSYLRSEKASAYADVNALPAEVKTVRIEAAFAELPHAGLQEGDVLIWYTEEQGKRYAAEIVSVNTDLNTSIIRVTAEGAWNEELQELMHSTSVEKIPIITEVQSQSRTVFESWIS
ncbi:hypothetical protein [Paenibacillus amylolyticus]|uniref:hypothetical protein n=1 Tax=Paenibacillus amylolyticus TaxID=1451 RepID=UPI003EBF86FD